MRGDTKMDNLHIYEIRGSFLVRRPGNSVRHIMQCTVIRTQVGFINQLDGGAVEAGISLIASGFQSVRFSRWFKDWIYPSDVNHTGDAISFPTDKHQAIDGRFIDVAVESIAFDEILKTAHFVGQHYVDTVSGNTAHPEENILHRPYSSPVVAVCIDGDWIEPISFTSDNSQMPLHSERD